MVKLTSIAVLIAAGLCVAPVAMAAEDASAQAKAAGCLNCHAVDATKKVGPGFKTVAASYKGKADAESTIMTKLTEGKGHSKVTTNKDYLAKIVKWVLAQ